MYNYVDYILTGHPRIADNFVRDKFTSLVQTHFLQRCPDPLRNEEDRVVAMDTTLNEDKLYKIPPMEIDGNKNWN